MRRTPLRRKTPLKSKGGSLKKTRLKQVSKGKSKWLELYAKAKEANPPPKSGMDPHHPFGRIGERILCFVWISQDLHKRIHDNSSWAHEVGWLQPEFASRKSTGLEPRPWLKSEESNWPDKYKRKP